MCEFCVCVCLCVSICAHALICGLYTCIYLYSVCFLCVCLQYIYIPHGVLIRLHDRIVILSTHPKQHLVKFSKVTQNKKSIYNCLKS